MSGNKKRNPNFSQNEKTLLLHCAFDEKEVIENKKTWRDKESAWNRIENKFNSQSGSCFRNSESLKRFYNNYKGEIRKEAAKEKSSAMQTGGGKPFTPSDPNFELAVTIMNPKTIYGLENEFDGDGFVEQQESGKCDENEKSNNNWSDCKPSMLKKQVHPKLKAPAHRAEDILVEDEISPDTESGSTQQIVMTKGFKKQICSSEPLDNAPWTARRRPVASTLHSSKISEQYSELSKIKIEIAKLQFDTLKEEAIQKKYQSNVEHQLKQKSLELDIAIKSEVLKKYKKKSAQQKMPIIF